MEPELYYWAREKKAASAEVDFVFAEDCRQRIVIPDCCLTALEYGQDMMP